MATKKYSAGEVSTKRLFSGFAGFTLATMMFATTLAVAAAPSATPPNGNVDPNFNNVQVSGYLWNGPISAPLVIADTLEVGGYGIMFRNNGSFTPFIENIGGDNIYSRDNIVLGSGKNLVFEAASGGKIYSGSVAGDGTTVSIDDNLSVSGFIYNPTANNSGRVVFSDDVEIRGSLVPQVAGGSVNVTAPFTNPTTGNYPVRVEDDFVVAGQITSTGNIVTSRGVDAGLDITTSGGKIGTTYRIRDRVSNPSWSNNTRYSTDVTCYADTYLVGCTGYVWETSGQSQIQYLGSEKTGANTCRTYARRGWNSALGVQPITNFTVYSEAYCFDPATTTRSDRDLF